MLISVANSRNASGKLSLHSTVMFGSGAGPRLRSVCKNRHDVFVTNDFSPSSVMPPTQFVIHDGSPAKSWA